MFKMSIKSLLILIFFLLFASNSNGFVNNNDNWLDKVSSDLIKKFEINTNVDIIVFLNNQYVQKAIDNRLSKLEKAKLVYENLKKNNLKNQDGIKALLGRFGYKYKQYFIVNSIAVKGAKIELVELLAKQREVEFISYDSPTKDPLEKTGAMPNITKDTTWGIKMIEVPDVWDLNIKGDGAVVGGQDTGYDWTHPALNKKYRGFVNDTFSNHNYNWHDAVHDISPLNRDSIVEPSNNPCGLNSKIPCDDYSHGTHTMGTMVGSNDSLAFGVAPEARWIGCRNMERGWGKPSTYIECFEWFIAPTDTNGENPDPALSPDVINNSWGCPLKEGCDSTNWKYMELALNNLRNSGVFVVVSAGNDGIRRCGSIRNPAAMFENAFTVGATRLIYDSTGVRFQDTIAGYSSRGPVTIDGSNRLKPDISAPGSGVLSCVPGNSYRFSNGTSMAGPHVVGVVALMISANPKLKGQVDTIEKILLNSADPKYDIDSCRGITDQVLPNSIYGYGRINAYKAVMQAINSSVSTKEYNLDNNSLIVFPNPFYDNLTIQFENETQDLEIEIYDLLGNIVSKKIVSNKSGLDLGYLNPGFYILKTKVNGVVVKKKILKL